MAMVTFAPDPNTETIMTRSMTPGLRRANGRPTRHPVVNRRGKAWLPHGRITLAESPELYMREEMG